MTEKDKKEILDALKNCEIRINKCFDKLHKALRRNSDTKDNFINVPIDSQFFDKMLTKDYLDKAFKKFREDLYRETGCTMEN